MFLIGVLIVIIMLYNVDPVFGKRPNKTDQQNGTLTVTEPLI